MARDYYEILGLSKSASDSEIKSSYRKLAMKYHPDRNPGDKKAEEKFKEISESYEILKDPQKKSCLRSVWTCRILSRWWRRSGWRIFGFWNWWFFRYF